MQSKPYIYRRLPREQRQDLLRVRSLRSLPAHEPPHYREGEHLYFITAACYEHAHILRSDARRKELADKLHERVPNLQAWVILPNHYHLVVTCDIEQFGDTIARLHNGTATQWNREDDASGRSVWYRFVDRRIRSQAHYFASANYIHWNPVKHGYSKQLQDWPTSSFSDWIGRLGREEMIRLWRTYPVRNYGKDWDVF